MNNINTDLVGIIDFDLLSTKTLCAYNYGVLLVSSYYKLRGSKVRLIIDLKPENLKQYSKIYIFKDYKTNFFPVNLIPGYYSLPVEEYGSGFRNRPLLPKLLELEYTPLSTEIYAPLLYYLKKGGKQFKMSKSWHGERYTPAMIFFENEGELLLREEPKRKRMLLFDEPLIFFNTELGEKKMTELKKKSIIRFIRPLRIGLVEPRFWEELFTDGKIVMFKKNLYSINGDKYLLDFIDWCKGQEEDIGKIKIIIKTEQGTKWFEFKGGKIYGNYGIEKPNEEGVDDASAEENISTRCEWFATKRFSSIYREDRKRTSKKKITRFKLYDREYERTREYVNERNRKIREGGDAE